MCIEFFLINFMPFRSQIFNPPAPCFHSRIDLQMCFLIITIVQFLGLKNRNTLVYNEIMDISYFQIIFCYAYFQTQKTLNTENDQEMEAKVF